MLEAQGEALEAETKQRSYIEGTHHPGQKISQKMLIQIIT